MKSIGFGSRRRASLNLIVRPYAALAPPLTMFSLIEPGLTKIAYCVELLAGVPTFLVMRRSHYILWWQFAIGGAGLGTIPALIMAFLHNPWSLLGLAFGLPSGALAGAIFWLICLSGGRARSTV